MGGSRLIGVGDSTLRGLSAMRQATQAHLWRWCSEARWNRDEKDRVIVVAQREWAEIVIEAQPG